VSGRTPSEVLRESRRRDSTTKRQRVRATIEEMLRTGDRITFAAVARASEVSTWLVYSTEYANTSRPRSSANRLSP
jgi:hypothetical protein